MSGAPAASRRAHGLREAHAHLAALGESLTTPSLAACTSVPECLDAVAHQASLRRPGGWALLAGARIEAWREARWPTCAELDRAAGDVPCVIRSFDHHAAAANTAALRAAGLRPSVPVPPAGVVGADAQGNPTGLLLEQAAAAAWHAAPAPTPAQRVESVRAALDHLAALGYIEVHDLLSQDWLGPALAQLEREQRLPLRVWLYAPLDHAGALVAPRAWESPRLRLAGLKAFADGTLNSRTALTTVPYREGTTDAHAPPGAWFGRAMMTQAELDAAMRTARGLGVGLAVHAIGDAAVRNVLDAWELQCTHHPLAPNATPALRIEHAELIAARDVPRFAELGVTCSVQPCHLLADVEALTRYLPHHLDRVLPLRELIDAGCRPGELLWFGSDVPIVPADPQDSVIAATQRRRPGTPPEHAIAWEQRISEDEAWRGFGGQHTGHSSQHT